LWQRRLGRIGRCRLVAAQPRRIVGNRPAALNITVGPSDGLSDGLTDRATCGGDYSDTKQGPAKTAAGKFRKSVKVRHRVDHKIGKPLTAMHIICAC
jgi:hypothetical protein